MADLLYNFGVSILSSVVACYVCRWMDKFFHQHGKDWSRLEPRRNCSPLTREKELLSSDSSFFACSHGPHNLCQIQQPEQIVYFVYLVRFVHKINRLHFLETVNRSIFNAGFECQAITCCDFDSLTRLRVTAFTCITMRLLEGTETNQANLCIVFYAICYSLQQCINDCFRIFLADLSCLGNLIYQYGFADYLFCHKWIPLYLLFVFQSLTKESTTRVYSRSSDRIGCGIGLSRSMFRPTISAWARSR